MSSSSSSSSSSNGNACPRTRTRTRTISKPAQFSRISPWDLIAGLVSLTLFTFSAPAESTNFPSEADLQGRALAQKILAQRPAENSTNTGVLIIRNEKGQRSRLPVTCETVVTDTNWLNRYAARLGTNDADVTTLTITHAGGETNQYLLYDHDAGARVGMVAFHVGMEVSGNRTMFPFARSDFWLCDLGLEFFHWPQQKVVKKEFHRQCACMVLESTNPNPSTNGYSRVVCWIDGDSLGIVEAFAYDSQGKRLKNFYPKNIEKVRGRYQVESMVMENLQTGSTSRLEFDLDQ